MITAAKEADLNFDEDLQHEIGAKLGKKGRERNADMIGETLAKSEEEPIRKRENKIKQKEQSLKQKYEREMRLQRLKKVSNSSFLTPEAAMYLNDIIRENQSKVDEEVVYAGLQETRVDKKNFQRKEKYTSRYTKARGQKRRRKGKFG